MKPKPPPKPSAKPAAVNRPSASVPRGRVGDSRIARIPKAVVKRLALYTRVLQTLELGNVTTVSSQKLAEQLGINSAQVRKDLAYYGQFGVPGLGYYVRELRQNLKRILGTDREVRVALVGVGNLGSALLSYGGFSRQGFRLIAAFDNDGRKIGSSRAGVPIFPIEELVTRVQSEGIEIAILSVPAEAAQWVCDQLVVAGITGILNFVPIRIVVPEKVRVQYVDLAVEMESLAYYLR